ncbi:uncharacterized protein Z518_01901 [Rhinocladiella mackenziei CBS 650.93]|uniref:Zn(2)-C6 fungal-type domain-containing protein n=1 Tax=Rhinocladiella mackenziei CBS 650.93 TaxID=1442369 RepID=A0A0D2H9S9_9EURO|nr:uncharacterized protein Z518_01901 [Rhinocladiella mackenziei CBS 650.93]KIX07248.1 hypothetical protein Z518_01901 [Rhinocladiella mackenziei CBS 650.93]
MSDMSEHRIWKQARRGTKSCTECRRRKIRCIRSAEDAQTCRSCEDRGAVCVAQIYSSRPVRAQRLPSRHRISQLESQVASLSKAIRDIQSKLGYQATDVLGPTVAQPESIPGTDDSDDDDSTVSGVLATEQPSQLRSLFQNDLLCVEPRQQNEPLRDRKAKASARLLDTARQALQKLILPKDEVSDLVRSATTWLDLAHALLPRPFAVKSQQELLDAYDNIIKPDVDVISLASWLLDVAVTAQQVPQDHHSPVTRLKRFQSTSVFTQAVSDTVEKTILNHDRLISTVQGLGTAVHFLRLQISQGNFQKSWLRLRHFIAVAELIGLPKISQSSQPNKAPGAADDETQLHKVQLWEFICSADRLLGMMINLPSGARRLQPSHAQALLTANGTVEPRVYLTRLTDIATKVQDLDDKMSTTTPESGYGELYASSLDLDRELRVLASQAPNSWWHQDVEQVRPDHIVQNLHYYIMMRVHWPFTVRPNPGGEEYTYSRLACMDACEAVARRYQFLRRLLPSGFFLCRILDLQAFTAMVILLLTSHSWPPMNRLDLQTNKARIDGVVTQVITLMDEKSHDSTGSSFTQHAVFTIRSLMTLLQQDGDTSNLCQMRLKVPLLGEVHIRRNACLSQPPQSKDWQSFPIPSGSAQWRMNEPLATPQNYGSRPLNPDILSGSATQSQAECHWNPLSWSIEDNHDNFFQDPLMAESFDQCDMWQPDYNNFWFQ